MPGLRNRIELIIFALISVIALLVVSNYRIISLEVNKIYKDTKLRKEIKNILRDCDKCTGDEQ